VLNYELAKEFGGRCNLRLDDTNPAKERIEYIDAIKRDVQWLGFDWAQGLRFASDYRAALRLGLPSRPHWQGIRGRPVRPRY